MRGANRRYGVRSGEDLNAEWAAACDAHGTRHTTSTPYNPRQNGVAEITNRSLCRIARAAISESGLSLTLWPEALRHACLVLSLPARNDIHAFDGGNGEEVPTSSNE